MIKYETLFIIKPDLPEDEIQAVLDRLQDRVSRVGGKTAAIRHWGNMELAYSVRYRGEVFRRGYYILLTYVGDGAAVDEVERNLKILETPFRYVTVRLESGVDPAAIGEVEISHQGPRTSVRSGGYRHEGDEGDDYEGGYGRRGRGREASEDEVREPEPERQPEREPEREEPGDTAPAGGETEDGRGGADEE